MARSGRRGAPDAVHPELAPQLRDALQFIGHKKTPSYGRLAMLRGARIKESTPTFHERRMLFVRSFPSYACLLH